MIGDWVCFDGDTEYTNPVQIDGISTEEACVDGDWYDVWEPIPLTLEILEKNGFCLEEEERGFSEPYQVYVNDEYQYVIKIYPKDGMDRYSKLIIGEYDDSENMSLLINYVHELQHALKLCGIEKEIQI